MPLLLKLRCRTVLVGLASLSASTLIGGDQVMPTIEPNTLKRRGVGLRALDQDRASPGVENRTVSNVLSFPGTSNDLQSSSTLPSILGMRLIHRRNYALCHVRNKPDRDHPP